MSQIADLLLLLLLLLPAAPIPAERKFDPDAAAKAVAPFLDERTVAVVHVDLARLDIDTLYEQLAALAKLKPDEFAEQKKALAVTLKKLTKAGAKDAFVVFSFADLPKQPPFLVLSLEPGADAETLAGIKDVYQAIMPEYEAEEIGQAVVVGAQATRQRLKRLKPVARPEVVTAFAASGDGLGRLVILDLTGAQNEIERAFPKLPKELGGGSLQPLTRGLRWATLKIETKPKARIQGVYQAKDKDSAKAAHDLFVKVGKSVLELKDFHEAYPNAEKVVAAFTPRLDGDRLLLSVEDTTLSTFLPTLAIQVRAAALRTASLNNLHQLGLAMHNYNDANGALPAVANFDKQNKPLLSWRVHLLPYLEEGKLYQQFHLDEPWDSEHNKKLIAKMPKVFANPYNPKLAAAGKTTYLAPVHKDAIFTGDKIGTRIGHIADGTSNTVMLVDVDDTSAVIWTKPDDLKLDPKNPHKALSARHGDKFLLLFADGAARPITKNIDKNTLWAIFTKAGGEAVNLP